MRDEIFCDNFTNTLRNFEQNLLANLNCVSIGKIEKVDFSSQTVEAKIIYKRIMPDGKIKDYPLLLDVPFVVAQGGGSYLGFPIKKGDYCILLFCDRNFSVWWDSGNEKEPESPRLHNLSDGLAIIGLNPQCTPIGYDGKSVCLFAEDKKIKLANKQTDLLTVLSELVDIIKSIKTVGPPATHQIEPASQIQLENYKKTLKDLLE